MDTRRVLVADIDGTLVGDDESLGQFAAWLDARRDAFRLAYATGRHLDSVDALRAATALPRPDAVISAVGTEIHDGDGRPWPGWSERLAGWSADEVRSILRPMPSLQLQAPSAQTPFKASYDVPDLAPAHVEAIGRLLARAGLPSTVAYSAGRYLDVLPAAAGKGRAARFLVDEWGVPDTGVLVFGDSGNDLQLFQQGFRGTLVANALPEIVSAVGSDVYRSPRAFAGGVMDGVRHWTTV